MRSVTTVTSGDIQDDAWKLGKSHLLGVARGGQGRALMEVARGGGGQVRERHARDLPVHLHVRKGK